MIDQLPQSLRGQRTTHHPRQLIVHQKQGRLGTPLCHDHTLLGDHCELATIDPELNVIRRETLWWYANQDIGFRVPDAYVD